MTPPTQKLTPPPPLKKPNTSGVSNANSEDLSPVSVDSSSTVETPMSSVPLTNSLADSPITLPKCFQKHTEKYTFTPKRIANDIIYYNANSDEFYLTVQPEDPTFKLWLLTGVDKVAYPNRRIVEEALVQNIHVEIKHISNFNMTMSQAGLRNIYYKNKLIAETDLPDAVLPRLGANVTQNGLSVMRQLEAMDILLLNPFSSIDLSRNKLYTMQTLAAHNLPIPKTMIAQPPFELKLIKEEFSFPLVLKRASGSQGKGVMLIQEPSMLEDIGDMISDSPSALIFQEYISHSHGRDLRVFVVGGRVLGPGKAMMREAQSGFKANIHQTGVGRGVKLSTAVEWLAIETSRLLGLDMAGVDILIDRDTYKICEINAAPGFEGFELATGTNVPQQLLEFIQLRLGLWRKKGKKTSHFVRIKPMNEHEREQQGTRS
mmetsp:Transcript_8274/g.30565  ORF Transcript_8274/g.30565 Transcript_8274/m.30565 type:complete len:431 (-) Transcript_8274:204-1496(-)|eukprot:CAMPEP_0117442854 /NCGR_PEP_ID=MMETSP0759-20121206/4377_1 /TAXON_ID=63605 /ORGANISM="Percolomonas cosmopolitus, Strain WS" /LENGTH=430 /DNA_ID=CAMNT_0005234777 /DNA_START=412 /DNA_END=1704 /DNA_ORIENTATION=-